MEHVCYRCGSPVEDQIAFCPSCGAAQIRVPSREPQPEVSLAPAPPPPPPEDSPAQQFTRPIRIHWRGFLRIALPLALVSGLTGVFWPLGLPVFFAGVIVAVRFYRKQHLGALHAAQGAQLGAVFALFSSLVFTALSAGACALQSGVCRDVLAGAIKDAASYNPTPQAQQIQHFFLQSDARLFGFFAFGLFAAMLFMVAMGTVTGALVAGLSRDKPNS